VIKSVSDLRQIGGFLRVIWFPPPIKVTATIVESGVKHHTLYLSFYMNWKSHALILEGKIIRSPSHEDELIDHNQKSSFCSR
jgi:hypothetical protein